TRRLCRGAPLTLHTDGNFQNAVFSPDGRWIAATTSDAVILFDARTGAEQWSQKGRSHLAAFSPDSGRVVAWVDGGNDPGLKFWDVLTHKELLTIPVAPPRLDVAQPNRWLVAAQLVFSPAGKWLAFKGTNSATAVWNAHTGEKKFDVPLKPGGLA